MTSSLSHVQIDALRARAGLGGFLGRRPAQTLAALQRKGLVRSDRSVTLLGQVTARLDGWIPTTRQCELIIALADGEVRSSTAYHLEGGFPRAPAGVIHRLRNAGAAQPAARPGWYTATNLGHELALILRQQTLPPPCGF